LNFKGPGGAGFLSHQDATAYATDQLASRHVSAMVSIDPATKENGAVLVSFGKKRKEKDERSNTCICLLRDQHI
jgi:2-aminoethylphosphonate dioxygenase